MCPFSAAQCSGVSPHEFTTSGAAPCFSSHTTASNWPCARQISKTQGAVFSVIQLKIYMHKVPIMVEVTFNLYAQVRAVERCGARTWPAA